MASGRHTTRSSHARGAGRGTPLLLRAAAATGQGMAGRDKGGGSSRRSGGGKGPCGRDGRRFSSRIRRRSRSGDGGSGDGGGRWGWRRGRGPRPAVVLGGGRSGHGPVRVVERYVD